MRTITQALAPYQATTEASVSIFGTPDSAMLLVCTTDQCGWHTKVWGELDQAETVAANHTRKHYVRSHA